MTNPIHGFRAGAGGILVATALAGLAILAPASGAAAQDARGMSFVGGLGYEQGGPGPSLVDALTAAGLDDEKDQRCAPGQSCPPVRHPFHFQEGLNVTGTIGARYRFHRPFSIQATVSNGQRGHAEGYNDDSHDHVVVGHASFLLSATAGLHVGMLRLEAGPALNSTFWRVTLNSTDERQTTTSVLGGTAGVSAGVRLKRAVVSLRTGVRVFPATKLGNTIQLPIASDYRSFYVGLTVVSVGD